MLYQIVRSTALVTCIDEHLDITLEMKHRIVRDQLCHMVVILIHNSSVSREFVRYVYRKGINFKVKVIKL